MFDDGLKYGAVTRALHWMIAALLVYQLGGVIAGVALGENAFTDAWGALHKPVGLLLFILAIARAVWGLLNLRRRPNLHPGIIGKLAVLGHLALYALVFVVPVVALIRQYGSGRPFEAFGISIMQGGHPKIEWMTKLGSDWHGELGWVLLAMIVLHVAMALVHRFVWRDGTMARMAG